MFLLNKLFDEVMKLYLNDDEIQMLLVDIKRLYLYEYLIEDFLRYDFKEKIFRFVMLKNMM
jgi:hypothetical protein